MIARALAAALVLAGLGAGPALACSPPAAGFRLPTTLDLAVEADTIVVARITGARGDVMSDTVALVLTPTLLIKGRALPRQVTMPRAYLAGDARTQVLVERSPPRELRAPNRGASMGGCVRNLFTRDLQLLVFLKRLPDGRFEAIREPFSRDAEDVTGPNALWVKAVREYAVIARWPRATWPERLRIRAAELRALRHPDATAVAADMDMERQRRRAR